MIKRGCRVLAVWAGLTAFGASASLPPLPAVWPAASLDTQVPGLPLPQGAVEGADHTVATEVDPPPFDQAARAALQAEAASRAPGLEGPPIPLAPPARMGDAAARQPGDADDTRRISLNLQGAGRGRVRRVRAVHGQYRRQRAGARHRHVTSEQCPWRDAFDTLLDTHGRDDPAGNVIWVTPAVELAARERERFEMHARAADLEPLASRTFALHYPRAQDVQRLLAGATGQRLLSKRGAAAADPRTNLLFVTDLAPRLDQVASLIEAIDRPSRQVRIEARIVEGEQGFRAISAHASHCGRRSGRRRASATFATGARNALDLSAAARRLRSGNRRLHAVRRAAQPCARRRTERARGTGRARSYRVRAW